MSKFKDASATTQSNPNRLTNMKIIDCFITKMPDSLFDPMPEVHVTYDNGEKEMLFRYYPDEVCFNRKEFLGLTRNEALALFHKKDKAYLQN